MKMGYDKPFDPCDAYWIKALLLKALYGCGDLEFLVNECYQEFRDLEYAIDKERIEAVLCERMRSFAQRMLDAGVLGETDGSGEE